MSTPRRPAASQWRRRISIDPGSATNQWRPTTVLLSAVTVAAIALFTAVLARRVDLLVLGTPFVAIVVWSIVTRPEEAPAVTVSVAPTLVEEGQSSHWHADIADAASVDQAVVLLQTPPLTRIDPVHGEIIAPVEEGRARVDADLQAMRWGRRAFGNADLTFISPWNAFALGPVAVSGPQVTATPQAELFSLAGHAPHPDGLVGLNRSRRHGDGSEFADIRAFRAGDRLRHIHWPVSARTGELHVRTAYAEQDTEVHLVVEATQEVGVSGGVHGHASATDLSVRAASALAHHLLQRGERVGLAAYGASTRIVPIGLGQRQLRRIIDTLAEVQSVSIRARRPTSRAPLRAGSGALVILLSPLIGRDSIEQTLRLHARGHTVVVVDCLPTDVTIVGLDDDPTVGRAWRLRLLEREVDIGGLQRLGIPVVPWRGPGSLDAVLQRLSARPRPRVARR